MATPLASLLDAFGQVDDPRKPRGIRHRFTSLLALTFVGLLCRETDFAGLQRWTDAHWRTLKGPLGFTRKHPPHTTTLSRALARFSLEQFRDGFARWLAGLPRIAEAVAAAVDCQDQQAGGTPPRATRSTGSTSSPTSCTSAWPSSPSPVASRPSPRR